MLKIVIDAGHGLHTKGKRCMKKLDASETREWTLNNRIADRLEKHLKAYDCEVLRVDDTTGYTDVELATRTTKSNKWKADVYLSIHHNAGINGGSGGGIVVYYYSSKQERKTQAHDLYNHLLVNTRLRGNRSEIVIKKDFYVLKNTNAPAFLIENGFMDSKTDVPIILSEGHANATVDAILGWLQSSFKLTKKASSETVVLNNSKNYEAIGRATEKCLNDIEKLDSFKQLKALL